jgi:outer membrane protein
MTTKYSKLALMAVLFAAVAFAQTTPASAATNATTAPAATGAASGTRVGVIDIQSAILATNEGQRDFGQLETKFTPKREEITKANKEIEELKKQLSTQGDKLNEEARAKLVKDIDSRQKNLQRSVEDAQADFQAQQNEIFNRIGQKLMDSAVKYANGNGIGVIIDASNPQSGVLWASEGMNITKPVVDAYNAASGIAPPANPPAAPSATRPGGGTGAAGAAARPGAPRPSTSPTTPKKP